MSDKNEDIDQLTREYTNQQIGNGVLFHRISVVASALKSQVDELREALQKASIEIDNLNSVLEKQTRTIRAYKGQITRLKNRPFATKTRRK